MGNFCSISIATEDTVAHCWDCTAGHAKYTVLLEDNLEDLKAGVDELRELRNDVVRMVNVQEQQQMKRLDQVESWLSSVEAEIFEVEQLIGDGPEQVQELCLGGCCSWNPLSGYKFGKKVAKKLEHVVCLKGKGAFDVVAERMPTAVVEERPVEPTVGLDQTLEKVWSCLMEENVGTIGIYGMGGIGKTTLLSQLNNLFLCLPCAFDVVIWVRVSKDLKLEKVQEDIGKRIGLWDELWKSKRVDEKASDIYRILSRKKFVLLLDDLWRRANLIEIGVPLPGERNGSKVVFTTRSKEVCGLMEAERIFKVECLIRNDAWELFERKVGNALSAHPDIPMLARDVAQKCCGLPLLLITVGRAMACKRTPHEWHHAVEVLSKCASVFSGLGDDVFPLLKFSFDSLPNDTVRSCFLYCILFLGRIYKESLIDHWIGEGLLDGGNDITGVRNQGHDVIGTLVYACLLEDRGDSVLMHDVIRDMALWIACKSEKLRVFLKAGAQLTEAPAIRKWEGVHRMSLMANSIHTLDEAPTCPNLQTLILSHNCLKTITNDFFQHMPKLSTLDLSCNKTFTELPIGISKLVSLQHLNLSMTSIRHLPIELKGLVHMRCLNLDHTSALVGIPKQLISSFSLLQVLRMVNCGSQAHLVEDGLLSCRGESLVEELESLKQLDLLCITIRSYGALQRLSNSHKLQASTQHLFLQFLGKSKSLDFSSLKHMKHLQVLRIGDCENLEVLKIETEVKGTTGQISVNFRNSDIMNIRCLNSLREVYIDYCPRLRDLTWVILARNMAVLSVSLCFEMEEIFSSEELNKHPEMKQNLIPFEKLEVLYLSHLPQLRSVYTTASALLCPCLQKVTVHNCPKLKKLPLKPSSSSDSKFILDGNWTGSQKWDKNTRSSPLP